LINIVAAITDGIAANSSMGWHILSHGTFKPL